VALSAVEDIDVRMIKTLQWAIETQKQTENLGLFPIITGEVVFNDFSNSFYMAKKCGK